MKKYSKPSPNDFSSLTIIRPTKTSTKIIHNAYLGTIKFKHRQKHRKHKKPSLPINIGDVRLRELRALSYPEYLLTYEWGLIREIILKLHPKCEVCKNRKASHVHHSYYSMRGREEVKDLIATCPSCHEDKHRTLIDGRKEEKEFFETIRSF